MTKEQIATLKASYEANAEDLITLRQAYEEGETEVEPDESFEQGYNNALEYVFHTLKIEFDSLT